MKTVDGLTLCAERRALLRPGELCLDRAGKSHRFPRFFYEVETAAAAESIQISAHFTLAELTWVDCREAGALRSPLHVPCAITVLARYLEELRLRVGAPVHIGANGGYRSPAHRRGASLASTHQWAAAADIYRIGDVGLDSRKAIERFGRIAATLGPEIHVKPFGHAPGQTDDHLHLDLGFLTLIPRGFCERPE